MDRNRQETNRTFGLYHAASPSGKRLSSGGRVSRWRRVFSHNDRRGKLPGKNLSQPNARPFAEVALLSNLRGRFAHDDAARLQVATHPYPTSTCQTNVARVEGAASLDVDQDCPTANQLRKHSKRSLAPTRPDGECAMVLTDQTWGKEPGLTKVGVGAAAATHLVIQSQQGYSPSHEPFSRTCNYWIPSSRQTPLHIVTGRAIW